MKIHMRAAAWLILIAGLGAGCSAPAPVAATDPLSGTPADLVIDLTVQRANPETGRDEAHVRPLRLTLLPDGSLHYGTDEAGRGVDWLPGKVRTLDRQEVAAVWSLLRQLGMSAADDGRIPENLELLPPPDTEVRYLLDIRADGARWQIVQGGDPEAARDLATGRLTRYLCAMAWAEDAPPEVLIRPRRYDLGPDPYERYRTP